MKCVRRFICLVLVALSCSLRAEEGGNEQSARLLRLDKFVVPEFPSFLRLSGVTRGSVAVAVGRDGDGHPADVLVLESSNPGFTDAALAAVQQWRFSRPDVTTPTPAAAFVPVVRFLFTASGVGVTAAVPADGVLKRARLWRADAPISLPNLDQLDGRPKALRQPMPTLAARVAGGAEGDRTVTVKYFVDTEGRVRVPTVMAASSAEVGAAALAAISQWSYEPPRLGGKPVIALETVSFRVKPAADS